MSQVPFRRIVVLIKGFSKTAYEYQLDCSYLSKYIEYFKSIAGGAFEDNEILEIKKCSVDMLKKMMVEIRVDFDNWKNRIISQASRLFYYYCYVKKEYPQEKSVSRSPYLFIDSKDGYEKAGAFEEYQKQVLSLNGDAESEIEKIKNCYHRKHNDEFNLICGKFLFESLYCHIRDITKIKFRKDDFRWHLICNFDIKKLEYVKDKILAVMSA